MMMFVDASQNFASLDAGAPDRVLVGDDHPVFRRALVDLVHQINAVAVIEEAGTFAELLSKARSGMPPQTILIDLLFPGLVLPDSIHALRNEFQRCSLIIVSMLNDDPTIRRVMAAGADGFISKSVAPDAVAGAIAAILAGEFLVLRGADGVPQRIDHQSDLALTPRQKDVWRLVAKGKTNKEIGRELGISPFTARLHVSAIMRVLDVKSRAAVAARAADLGFA